MNGASFSHHRNSSVAQHLPIGIGRTAAVRNEGWFVGSIDQGTTSTRFIIFNGKGDPVAGHQIEFDNRYPQSGYVQAVSQWDRNLLC
jgi:hypothetical protein